MANSLSLPLLGVLCALILKEQIWTVFFQVCQEVFHLAQHSLNYCGSTLSLILHDQCRQFLCAPSWEKIGVNLGAKLIRKGLWYMKIRKLRCLFLVVLLSRWVQMASTFKIQLVAPLNLKFYTSLEQIIQSMTISVEISYLWDPELTPASPTVKTMLHFPKVHQGQTLMSPNPKAPPIVNGHKKFR